MRQNLPGILAQTNHIGQVNYSRIGADYRCRGIPEHRLTPSTRQSKSSVIGRKVKSASLILLVVCLFLGCGAFRRADRNHERPPAGSTSSESQAAAGTASGMRQTSADSSLGMTSSQARKLAEEMIGDCLSWAWVRAYRSSEGKKPVVSVGIIQDRTGKDTDAGAIRGHVEAALSRSDQVSFVATRSSLSPTGETNVDPPDYASREVINKIRSETGADFVLVGTMSFLDQSDAESPAGRQLHLEMINAGTLAKVWRSTRKIEKQHP